MTTLIMTNPLDKIKKLRGRSWDELKTRGEQLFAGYTEKMGLSGKIPTDQELNGLIDKRYFGKKDLNSEAMLDAFFENGRSSFFAAFADRDASMRSIRKIFPKKLHSETIERANRILEGKFDILGYQNLDFGEEINWHFEPLSGKASPLKHWKEIDELSTEETGDKKITWEINRHQHFFSLGFAYWLTKDERYAAAFARHIASWMKQNPPGMGINWLSSLEVSFRAVSWLWGLHFFEGSQHLSGNLFKDVLKFLYLHGKHIERYLSTYYSPNTHLTGEAIGLYYLGTQLPFFQRAGHWRELGSELLLAEIEKQILPDGVYFEQSTWYQKYTVDFYLHFQILRSLNEKKPATGSEHSLNEKLQLALDFLMYAARPDGTTPAIGDDDGGKMLPFSNRAPNDFRPSLATAGIVFNRGDYKFAGNSFAEETFWLLGTEGFERHCALAAHMPRHNSASFAAGGYFIMRDGWAASDNYMIIDCGKLGALNCGHSHADALSIDLSIGGRRMLIDPGTYTYHESQMWRDFFRSTTGHNTLSIDGRSSSEPGGKFSWQSEAESKPTAWLSEDRFDFFEGGQDGYQRLETGAATHSRSVLFLKNDYWIMRDYIETFGSHDYQLNFHFDSGCNPEIKSNGTWHIDESAEGTPGMRLYAFGDNGQWQKKESWVSPCYGKKVNAPFLRFISDGTGPQEFFTFILPQDEGFDSPSVQETEIAGGRAFVVRYRGYSDLFVFGDGDGRMVRTELFDTDFRFFWARISDEEQLPEEFVLIDGCNFHLDGREIVSYPHKLKFLNARRLGNKLNVRTNESVFSVSLREGRSSTRILKDSEQSG